MPVPIYILIALLFRMWPSIQKEIQAWWKDYNKEIKKDTSFQVSVCSINKKLKTDIQDGYEIIQDSVGLTN